MAAHSCGGCSNEWGGLAQCHCASCHSTFSGITAFDRHRSKGKCLEPDKMLTEIKEDGTGGELVFEVRNGIWSFPSDTDWNARFGRETVEG